MGDCSKPAICLTVSAATTAELRTARDAAETADLVELRLDTVRDPDVAGALSGRTRPVLITCRAAWEGGHFTGSEEERLRLLDAAWTRGAEFVDVEHRAPGARAFLERTRGERVVLSHHDFDGIPRDLAGLFDTLSVTRADVVKLAVTARRVSDALPLFALGQKADRSFVALAMGAAGLSTRLLAARIGSRWSYAGSAAPGQLSPSRMVDEFRFRAVTARTAVYGVVGNPVLHSLSPAMHNAAFEAAGIDGVYLPVEAADADDFLRFADALGMRGASVTAPFKLALASAAKGDAEARRVGAINTLRRGSAGWDATNTDIEGFLAPLEARLPLDGIRASILGAGGAARAAAAALRSRGARVVVHARRLPQAEAVAAALEVEAAEWPPARGSWDLLVNTTPVGTAPRVNDSPWPDGVFDGRLVYDLVYNPPQTRLLGDAARAGCDTLGGLDMLVAQARRQFEWWTGVRPDAGVMREAALRRLSAGSPPEARPGPSFHSAAAGAPSS
jgi:3-dehydroquinate dehydratase/shikimate dehydrogenase